MISNNPSSNVSGTFSANVRLHLFVNDCRFEVASLGPNFAILRGEQPIVENNDEPTTEIETIIDDKVTRWPIRITSRLDGQTRRFEFESLGQRFVRQAT